MNGTWSCTEPSPTASQHIQWIIEAGPAMMAQMFFPIPLLVIMYILSIDAILFQIKHSVNWRRTVYYIWILAVFPILGSLCVLMLFVPRTIPIASFASSFYFALTVKKFFHLTLNYFGGKKKMEEALKGDLVVSSNPFPCCFVCCCHNQPMDVHRINQLQVVCYQIVFVYPIGLFIQVVLVGDGIAGTNLFAGLAVTVIGLLMQLSSFICLYGYMVLAKCSRFALQQFHFRAKYISVQAIIAFNTIQKFTLKMIGRANALPCGFPFPSKETPLLFHSYLLIYELFLLCILAWYFFKFSDEGCEVVIPEASTEENNYYNTDSGDSGVVAISIDEKYISVSESESSIETTNETQDKELEFSRL